MTARVQERGRAAGRGASARPPACRGDRRSRTRRARSRRSRPDASRETTRDKLRAQLRAGRLDDRLVELEMQQQAMPMIEVLSGQGIEEMGINLKDMLSNVMPTRTKRRKVTVAEAQRLLAQEEAQKLIDMDEVVTQAIRRVENSGIVFLDELDKIAGREGGHGPDVSRARASSATSCPSSRARRSRPSTGSSAPTTSCSSPPAPSTSPSRPTSSPSSRGASRSGSSSTP